MATSAATCGYCSELFTDPRMLPCLHSFCVRCLDKVSEIEGAKEALQCPACNEKGPLPKDGVHGFPKDLRKAHEAVVAQCRSKLESEDDVECDRCNRKNKAIALCIDCGQFLCKACEEDHSSWRETLSHNIVAAGEKMGKRIEESIFSYFPEQTKHCSRHKEVLNFYCETCERMICRDCREDGEHDEHRSQCRRVEDIAKKAMEGLMMSFESSEEAIAKLDSTIDRCEEVCQQVELRKEEVDNMITQSLNQTREVLLAKNEEIRSRKITGLKMQMEKLKRVRDGLSLASEKITAAQTHTPAQQLSTKKVMADRAAILLQQFRDSDLTPLENDRFLTNIAERTVVSQMISLGQIVGGSHAASSTCEIGYISRAIEHTIKVTARDEAGKPFPHGGEMVIAKLSLMGSQEPLIHGKTTDHGNGNYSISFTAKSAGKHQLQVTIANRHIKGSPFTLTVREPHAPFSTCDVGYIPRVVVAKQSTIKVTVRDQEGELFPHGGEVVEAKLSLVGSQEPLIHGKTSDHGNGTYSISFTAQSAGKHELQVTISNRHIKGSPFPIAITQPHAASSICDIGYIPRAVVGQVRTIKVTSRDEKGKLFPIGGELVEGKLSEMRSSGPAIHGTTSDHGNGTYLISFTAQSAGKHELQVTIGKCHIKGSPFTLTVRQPRTISYTNLARQKNFNTNSTPYDVAVTEGGYLAVVEYGYHTVRLYSVNGQQQSVFGINNGGYGSGDAQFYYPVGVAIKGNVMYVSESHNHRVQKFNISPQSFTSKFGSNGNGDGQFSSPRGICIDPEGKVYVADWNNNRIQVFQADDKFAYSITANPMNPKSQFKNPWGLAFDTQGHLHVAAYNSNSIKIFTPEGVYIDSYGDDTIQYPAGIAINEQGYIAIAEYGGNSRVWIYDPTHTRVIKMIQDSSNPIGVSFDAEGMLWVAASGNHCIRGY